MNVQLWGDSICRGVVLDEKKGRYTFLEDNKINKMGLLPNINFKNKSIFGQTTTRMISKLKQYFISGNVADYVIVELGGNDCDLDWQQVGDNPKNEHKAKTVLEDYEQRLDEIIEFLRSNNSVPVFVSLPPLEYDKFFDWVTQKNVNKDGVLEYLGTTKAIYDWQESYDNSLRKVCERNKVNLIDIRSKFLESKDYGSLLCLDGMHPNEIGNALIADTLMESFVKIIQ